MTGPTHPVPADPWVHESLTIGYATTGSTLTLPPPRRSRRRAPMIVLTVGLIVALVAGGLTLAAGYVWYGWGATEPEEVLPDSVAAFARVDLSPGLGQQLKLGALAKKFPHTGSDAVEQWRHDLIAALHLDPLTYDDVQPWLGDRFAVAGWSADGTAARLCQLTALASTDDARAGSALSRAPAVAYGFAHGYAIVAHCDRTADNQSTLDAALAAAGRAPLSRRTGFTSALSALPSGQAVVGWADLARATALSGQWAGLAASGEAMVGIRATDDGVEARLRVAGVTGPGVTGPGATVDALTSLAGLPGVSTVAVSADLRGLRGLGAHLPAGDTGAALRALLGSVLSVSVTDVVRGPQLRLVAEGTDPDQARDLSAAVNALAGLGGLRAGNSGTTLTLSTAGYSPGTSTLGQDPLFQQALAGAPPGVLLAGYVDVGTLAPALHLRSDQAANLAPVRAVGLSLGYADGVLTGLARVIVR